MKTCHVASPANFDSTPEFAMGLHVGWEPHPQRRKQFRDDLVYLVLNGSLAISLRDLHSAQHSNSNHSIKFQDDEDGASRDWAQDFPAEETGLETRPIIPCEDIDIVSVGLGLSLWQTQRLRRGGHVHGSPAFVGSSRNGERFMRYSAFEKDRRLTPSYGLLSGSFATSSRDAAHVSTALTVVGRFALPSIHPPRFCFEIVPPPLTDLYYGTVSPAFGQSGGGTEIEFWRGVAGGSVSGPSLLPVY
jgi:hypothetical protein